MNTMKDEIKLQHNNNTHNVFEINVHSVLLFNAHDKLKRNSNLKFRVYFSRRNSKRNLIENLSTIKVDLIPTTMYFNNEKITFKDIDILSDKMELSFVIIGGEQIERMDPFNVNLKHLIRDKNTEVTWYVGKDVNNEIHLTYYLGKANETKELNTIRKIIHDNSSNSNNNNMFGIKSTGGIIMSPSMDNVNKQKSFLFTKNNCINTTNNINNNSNSNHMYKNLRHNNNINNNNIGNNINNTGNNFTRNTPMNILNSFIKPTTTSKTNYINLSYEAITPLNINDNINFKYDTFCTCILVTGLNTALHNNHIIPNTYDLSAPCNHRECSLLQSLEPSLLHMYLHKNSTPFPNEFISSICHSTFPSGIKVCYHCSVDNKNKKFIHTPKPQQTFYTVIKNPKNEDDIYYMATLQYFVKITKKDFDEKYSNLNTLQLFLNETSSSKLVSNTDKKFKELFQTISHLMMNNIVLIPESISLISKFPFLNQMDSCLKCIINLPKTEMNQLISYIINEIPYPSINKTVTFYLPRTVVPLQLYNINNIEDNITNINLTVIFDYLSIDNIVLAFQLVLLEQKILFVDNNYKLLSQIVFAFMILIYPLMWVNPYAPVLPLEMIKYIESIVPFIFGLDEYMLDYAMKNVLQVGSNDNIVVVNVHKNTIGVIKLTKVLTMSKKELLRELELPDIPDKVGSFLVKTLKDVKKKYKQYKDTYNNNNNTHNNEHTYLSSYDKVNEYLKEYNDINKHIKDVFVKAMIMLIGDYHNFTFITNDKMPLFNEEAFLNTHTQKDMKCYLKEFISTQNFYQFLFHSRNKCKNYLDMSYFISILSKHQNLINTQQVRQRSTSVKNSKRLSNKNTNRRFSLSKPTITTTQAISNHLNSSFHNTNGNHNKSSLNLITNPHLRQTSSSSLCVDNNNNHSNTSTYKTTSSNVTLYNRTMKKFLLVPYFLNDNKFILKNEITEQIYTMLQKKNAKDVNLVESHCFVISNQKEYQFEHIKHNTVYLLSIKEQHMYKRNNIMNHNIIFNSFQNNNNNNKTNNERIMNIKQQQSQNVEMMKDHKRFLDEMFKSIITSKKRVIDYDKVNSILNESYEYKEYLITSLIFPDYKISNEENHKQLTIQSYAEFYKLAKIVLKAFKGDKRDLNLCRLVTLACFSYYKLEKDILKYVYEDLIKDKVPTQLWVNEDFWVNFFEEEMQDTEGDDWDSSSNNSNNNNNNNNTNVDNSNEKIISEAISTITDIMVKLELNKQLINTVIFERVCKKYTINEKKKQELKDYIG